MSSTPRACSKLCNKDIAEGNPLRPPLEGVRKARDAYEGALRNQLTHEYYTKFNGSLPELTAAEQKHLCWTLAQYRAASK